MRLLLGLEAAGRPRYDTTRSKEAEIKPNQSSEYYVLRGTKNISIASPRVEHCMCYTIEYSKFNGYTDSKA